MVIIGLILGFVGLAYLCWLLFRVGSLCASAVRRCRRWACRLSQRFGADRRDPCWRDRRQHHSGCRPDRVHDAPVTPDPRGDRIPLRVAGGCRGISRRPWPRVHRWARRRLATRNSSCGRNHRGGNSRGAHDILSPARRRRRRCHRRRSARSADVIGHARLSASPPIVQWQSTHRSRVVIHDHGPVAVAFRLTRRGAFQRARDDSYWRRCAAQSGDAVAAHQYARISFLSPDQRGLLCG